MSSKTIFDAFFSLLPSFTVDDAAVYRKVSTTATSTVNEEPLRALKWEHYDSILHKGREHLSNIIPGDNDILCQPATIPLQGTIKTEADVMAQAILHLLYQVNHTVNRHLQNGHIEANLESAQKGSTNARTDYLWTFRPHIGSPVSFAVLEMKAPNLIARRDFIEATAITGSEEKEKLRRAHFQQSGTLLAENGKIFIQQVKKYLRILDIKDVALFDWNHLVILDTEGLNEDTSEPRLARFTWFEENRDSRDYENGMTYSMMILGFLLRAMSRYPQIG